MDNVEGDDGNGSRKTARDDARSFTETVPQAAVDFVSRNGGITLTNEMFGIVDLDTPADQVRISLVMDLAGNLLDTRPVGSDDGVPTGDDGLPLRDVGRTVDAAIVGRVIVDTGAAGTPAWKVLGAADGDSTVSAFTLAQLTAGKVRFLHNAAHEGSSVTLRLHSVTDGQAAAVFQVRQRGGEVQQSDVDADAAAADVVLRVTPRNDQPVQTASAHTVAEGAITTLSKAMLAFEDYDVSDGPAQLTLRVGDLSGLAGQALLQRQGRDQQGTPDGSWDTLADGDSFTMEEIETSAIRIVHLGQHPASDAARSIGFTVTADDDESGAGDAPATAGVFTLTVTPRNDRPTDIRFYDRDSLGQQISRINTAKDVGDSLFVLSVTDEERDLPGIGEAHYSYLIDSNFETDGGI